MIEIYQDGKLKLTITEIGSTSDIVILPKQVAEGATMTANGFDQIFYACLSGAKSNAEAYEKAEEIHLSYFQKRKYSGYQSFAVSKSQRFKK